MAEADRLLRALATEMHRETDHLDPPELPTTVSEIIRLVDASDGVHFGDLLTALGVDPDAAHQALTDLLAIAAALADQPSEHAVDVDQFSTDPGQEP